MERKLCARSDERLPIKLISIRSDWLVFGETVYLAWYILSNVSVS